MHLKFLVLLYSLKSFEKSGNTERGALEIAQWIGNYLSLEGVFELDEIKTMVEMHAPNGAGEVFKKLKELGL